MSAVSTNRRIVNWFSRPAGAVAASLATVVFFVGLLGFAFLPREFKALLDAPYVSVTHSLDLGEGRPAVSLFWSMTRFGLPGWRHHLAVHPPRGSSEPIAFPFSQLRPLSLAKGLDADHALVGNWDGGIYSIETTRPSSPPLRVARQPSGAVIALAATSDAHCILSQSAFCFYAWDVATQTQRWRRQDVAAYCFAARPDEAELVVATNQGELLSVDLRTGRTLRSLARLERGPLTMSLSSDGSKLAVILNDGRLCLLDSHTGAALWNDRTKRNCLTGAGRYIAFSPCGTLLVTAGRNSHKALAVWSVAEGRRLKELHGHEGVVIGASFTPSGILRSWGADGTIRDWNLFAGIASRVATMSPPPVDS